MVILLTIPIIIISLVIVWWFATRINTTFATKALLEFHHLDISISTTITDEHDISVLREILRGNSFSDSFPCNFTRRISITMTDGSRSIMFHPATDGCPILRLGDSDRYIRITEEARTRLNEVVAKYGMFFPAIN